MNQEIIPIGSYEELIEFFADPELASKVNYRKNPHLLIFQSFYNLQEKYGIEEMLIEDSHISRRIKTEEDFEKNDYEYITLFIRGETDYIFRYSMFTAKDIDVFIENKVFGERIKMSSESENIKLLTANTLPNVQSPDYRYVITTFKIAHEIIKISKRILSPQ